MSSPLAIIERHYDTSPRVDAEVRPIGPFTLFVARPDVAWPYYARPTPGCPAITGSDLDELVAAQRDLRVPHTIEWVHESTPSLGAVVEAAGWATSHCPLLLLDRLDPVDSDVSVRILSARDPNLADVVDAVSAGFAGVERDGRQPEVTRQRQRIREGWAVMDGAFDAAGWAVGGGTHLPRGAASELVGIAVVPSARRRGAGARIAATLAAEALDRGIDTVFLSAQDDAVARVYETVGFRRIGTACIATLPAGPPP
jgi:GNAT superfamily N-acetyltransferase